MKPSNTALWKIVIIALLIFIFSLTLRYDFNNYPKGVDTYELYGLSKDVQDKGYVVWNTDFFTALGMTSFSYPSGGIIFLAQLSELTNINLTNIILIWNYFLLIICALLLFVIAKVLFYDNFVSILLVLIYLNTRFFISYSTFFTSRNILHIFFLTILFLLVKKLDIKKSILIVLLLCVSFMTHRATILIGIFIFGYILAKYLIRLYNNNLLHNLIFVILGVAIFFASVYFFGHINIGSETTKIPFNIGIDYFQNLISIIFSISMHYGILIALVPFGYLFLIIKKDKSYNDLIILLCITIGLGFMIETIYFFYFFLPIFSILIGYFLNYIINSNRRHYKILIIFIIIICLIIPIYITIINKSISDSLFVRKQTIELTGFLNNEKLQKSIICNNHIIYCSQINSISTNVTALTQASGRTFIDRVNVTKSKITLAKIRTKITFEDDILRTALYSDSYTSAIINWNNNPPILKKLLDFTNVGYVLDSNNLDSIRNQPRIKQKFGDMNQIYDNGLQQIKVIN